MMADVMDIQVDDRFAALIAGQNVIVMKQ